MDDTQAKALRAPFPDSAIGKLPKAGIQLDYIGHAAVTDRLLAVDPEWTWEPCAFAANGTPLWTVDGNSAVMWIRLTVCGVSRLGVGICRDNATDLEKQLISDALRNAAMRFGVALDLWSKEDLHASQGSAETEPAGRDSDPHAAQVWPNQPPEPVSARMSTDTGEGSGRTGAAVPHETVDQAESPVSVPVPVPPSGATAVAVQAPTPAQESELSTENEWTVSPSKLAALKTRVIEFNAEGASVSMWRSKANLPPLSDKLKPYEVQNWDALLDAIETFAAETKANA